MWDGNNKKRLYQVKAILAFLSRVMHACNIFICCIFQYAKYPSSIAALSFSRDGRLLAVASSYTYEEGDKLYESDNHIIFISYIFPHVQWHTALYFLWLCCSHEPDSIFVRNVNEGEVKPKPKVFPTPPPWHYIELYFYCWFYNFPCISFSATI